MLCALASDLNLYLFALVFKDHFRYPSASKMPSYMVICRSLNAVSCMLSVFDSNLRNQEAERFTFLNELEGPE